MRQCVICRSSLDHRTKRAIVCSVECRRVHQRNYQAESRIANPEKHRLAAKNSREKHIEKSRARERAYQEKNREQRNSKKREAWKDPDQRAHLIEINRRYKSTNREKINRQQRERYAEGYKDVRRSAIEERNSRLHPAEALLAMQPHELQNFLAEIQSQAQQEIIDDYRNH